MTNFKKISGDYQRPLLAESCRIPSLDSQDELAGSQASYKANYFTKFARRFHEMRHELGCAHWHPFYQFLYMFGLSLAHMTKIASTLFIFQGVISQDFTDGVPLDEGWQITAALIWATLGMYVLNWLLSPYTRSTPCQHTDNVRDFMEMIPFIYLFSSIITQYCDPCNDSKMDKVGQMIGATLAAFAFNYDPYNKSNLKDMFFSYLAIAHAPVGIYGPPNPSDKVNVSKRPDPSRWRDYLAYCCRSLHLLRAPIITYVAAFRGINLLTVTPSYQHKNDVNVGLAALIASSKFVFDLGTMYLLGQRNLNKERTYGAIKWGNAASSTFILSFFQALYAIDECYSYGTYRLTDKPMFMPDNHKPIRNSLFAISAILGALSMVDYAHVYDKIIDIYNPSNVANKALAHRGIGYKQSNDDLKDKFLSISQFAEEPSLFMKGGQGLCSCLVPLTSFKKSSAQKRMKNDQENTQSDSPIINNTSCTEALIDSFKTFMQGGTSQASKQVHTTSFQT